MEYACVLYIYHIIKLNHLIPVRRPSDWPGVGLANQTPFNHGRDGDMVEWSYYCQLAS